MTLKFTPKSEHQDLLAAKQEMIETDELTNGQLFYVCCNFKSPTIQSVLPNKP